MISDKYKGIDIERIKQIQKINFPHLEHEQANVHYNIKESFSRMDLDVMEEWAKEVNKIIENKKKDLLQDEEMFVICEMAKLYLENRLVIKSILCRLELESELFHLSDTDCVFAIRQDKALNIVKEEGGLNG